MKRILLLMLASCSLDGGKTSPPTTPPPPWGVPISGGNMIVTHDGRAVIADADRDRIMIVDTSDAVTEIPLAAGSEPGRLVEDVAGRIHVALRGSGELLTLAGDDRQQRHVCGDPRGLAVDGEHVYIACATGELVTATPTTMTTQTLGRDLRDVIVSGGRLYVTRFHSAELIDVTSGTKIVPPTVKRDNVVGELGMTPTEQVDATPEVAWRTIALPDGSFVMSHQRKRGMQLKVVVGGYTTPCGDGPVESAITHVRPDGTAVAVAPMLHSALPVDVALSPDGSELAFAAAGRQVVERLPITALSSHDDDKCGDPHDAVGVQVVDDQLGTPTSVAYAPNGALFVYYPELPALVVHGPQSRTIRLPGPFGYDAGRALFHRQTASGMACASCHPEGRDDGQVWEFGFGARRTQSLAGGILGRAPFHWSGDMADMDQLMTAVFEQRMAGFTSTHSEHVSLGPWLDRVPAPAPVLGDADAIARGEALFNAPEQGCVSCHQGENFTTNALADVGTGGMFKTPSLIGVGARAPFLHNGCALTLRDRFGVCGGGEAHGRTSHLTQEQISDLVTYLESL